jgi:very-short-patch-repair endonuclease
MRSFTSIHGSATGRRQAELEQHAWRNRRALTDSEAALWEALRARKLGVQFRRQVPLCGRFIADFYAAAARLVVEVDGGSHHGRESADARRDRMLARAGVRTLRLSAELVVRDVSEAVALVVRALVDCSAQPRRSTRCSAGPASRKIVD